VEVVFGRVAPLALAQAQPFFGHLNAVFAGNNHYNAFQPFIDDDRKIFGHIGIVSHMENLLLFRRGAGIGRRSAVHLQIKGRFSGKQIFFDRLGHVIRPGVGKEELSVYVEIHHSIGNPVDGSGNGGKEFVLPIHGGQDI